MKFSVITPCYNAQSTIAQTIESVIYQRGPFDIQYIIVDGNSTDNTLAIVNKYREGLEKDKILKNCLNIEFIVISEKDSGMYDALVKGLKIADGDITSYINADDFYLPNALLSLQYIFEGHPGVNWLTCTNTWYNSIGTITYSLKPFRYKQDLIQKGFHNGRNFPHIQQESTFWRTKLNQLLDFNILSEYKLAGDFYIWYTFSIENKLHTLLNQLSGFRVSENQKSNDMDLYNKEFNEIMIETPPSLFDHFIAFYEKLLWNCPSIVKNRFKFPTKLVLNNTVISNIEKRTNFKITDS
jgi:glycosyltransferase involved in cell wall biosynthesis